jgi:hypothetical protein
LIAIEPFGAPAELQALQLLHDQPQPLDLGLRLRERLPLARPLRRQPTDHLMQGIKPSSGKAARSTSIPRGYTCSRHVASASPNRFRPTSVRGMDACARSPDPRSLIDADKFRVWLQIFAVSSIRIPCSL